MGVRTRELLLSALHLEVPEMKDETIHRRVNPLCPLCHGEGLIDGWDEDLNLDTDCDCVVYEGVYSEG